MKKKTKYNNTKVKTKYGTFDSKKEYSIWLTLVRKQKLGEIKNLRRQVPFTLIDKSEFGREIKYICDYLYEDCKTGEISVLDCKSDYTEKNPVFQLKARIFAERYKTKIKIIK